MKFTTLFQVASVASVFAMSFTSSAITITGPLTSSEIGSLVTGNKLNPPPSVRFFEPGPLTLNSGTKADLYAGPKLSEATGGVLLVLSGNVSSLSGNITFNLAGVGSVSFGASDFFTGVQLNNLDTGNNGDVNGIKWDTSKHAGLRLNSLNLGLSEGTDFGDVTITSPIDLRVDVFGIAAAAQVTQKVRGKDTVLNVPEHLVNKTPNSGDLGILASPTSGGGPGGNVPDGGATAALLGLGTIGLAALRMRK